MATYLSSIYGTEIDRVNCSFYNKIGACRHGERCSRKHIKPSYSTVVMCPNLYRNPTYELIKYEELEEKKKKAEEAKKEAEEKKGQEEEEKDKTEENKDEDVTITGEKQNDNKDDDENADNKEEKPNEPSEAEKTFKAKYHDPEEIVKVKLSPEEIQKQFDDFFKDLFIEVSLKFGIVEDIVVTENFNHLNGNVYIRFRSEESADMAVANLNSRWYDRKPVFAELSPVQNFDEAICGSYNDTGDCSRSVNCNFWHVKKASSEVRRELFAGQRKFYKEKGLWDKQPPKTESW